MFMANFSVTAANVVQSSNAQVQRGTAGVPIIAGQVLYLDASSPTRLLQLAAANLTVSGNPIVPVGIAVNSAAAGQQVNYVALDPAFTPGIIFAGFPAGTAISLVLSRTPGLLCQPGDLIAGDQQVFMMLPTGTATASLSIVPAGVVLP